MNDGEGGRWKKDGGVRGNQMNDRIQVFGFARQPLGCLYSLREPMVSDYSVVIWPPVSRSQTANFGWEWRNDKLKRRRRRRRRPGGERGV